ncbi:site-specific DNA-methyltransferase, partial [Mycoplasma bovis]|nr:site-specific DNA-methyltransferase [Mycoplasmopsis bovis]
RISSHTEFVKKRVNEGKLLKHYNSILGTEVMTSQEKFISFNKVSSINKIDDKTFEVIYKTLQSE